MDALHTLPCTYIEGYPSSIHLLSRAMIESDRCLPEGRVKAMVIDALIAIQGGQNPRVIASMLKAYLPESQRDEDE